MYASRSTQTTSIPAVHKFRTPSPDPVPDRNLGAIPKHTPTRSLPPSSLEPGSSNGSMVAGSRKGQSRQDRGCAGLDQDDNSSGSSPDNIDAILNRTLNTSRCEPLSPQEMDAYLTSIYRQRASQATAANGRIRKTKSVSVPSWMKDDEILADEDDDDLPAAQFDNRSDITVAQW